MWKVLLGIFGAPLLGAALGIMLAMVFMENLERGARGGTVAILHIALVCTGAIVGSISGATLIILEALETRDRFPKGD